MERLEVDMRKLLLEIVIPRGMQSVQLTAEMLGEIRKSMPYSTLSLFRRCDPRTAALVGIG